MRKKESFEIQKSLGNCYLRTNQFDHAELHYREAFAITPDSPTLLVNIGCLSLSRQDPDAATLHFQEAIRHDPQNTRAFTGLGLAYLLKTEKKAAHEAFAKALEIDIKNPTALFYLVKCAYENKNYSTAADILQKYIDSQPFNSNLLYALAGLLYHRGDSAACLAMCERLLAIKPDHVGAEKLKKLAAK
jgi:cytochrome c-type biogenesis protein CcmH/NrfG